MFFGKTIYNSQLNNTIYSWSSRVSLDVTLINMFNIVQFRRQLLNTASHSQWSWTSTGSDLQLGRAWLFTCTERHCLLPRTRRWCLVMPLQMCGSHTFMSCHHVFISRALQSNATYRMDARLLDLQANAPTAELPTPHSQNVSVADTTRHDTHDLFGAV